VPDGSEISKISQEQADFRFSGTGFAKVTARGKNSFTVNCQPFALDKKRKSEKCGPGPVKAGFLIVWFPSRSESLFVYISYVRSPMETAHPKADVP
jgi:hypothetical protein